jgi:hypothetical protein
MSSYHQGKIQRTALQLPWQFEVSCYLSRLWKGVGLGVGVMGGELALKFGQTLEGM